MVFTDEELPYLHKLAEANKHRIAFATVDSSESRILEWMGVKSEDFPVLMINVSGLAAA